MVLLQALVAHEQALAAVQPGDGPLNGSIINDKFCLSRAGRLRLSWTYSEARHRRETIEEVAGQYLRRLRSLIEHCTNPDTGAYTPSDFPAAELSQQELDKVLAEVDFNLNQT